jgi:hypothetical protein
MGLVGRKEGHFDSGIRLINTSKRATGDHRLKTRGIPDTCVRATWERKCLEIYLYLHKEDVPSVSKPQLSFPGL